MLNDVNAFPCQDKLAVTKRSCFLIRETQAARLHAKITHCPWKWAAAQLCLEKDMLMLGLKGLLPCSCPPHAKWCNEKSHQDFCKVNITKYFQTLNKGGPLGFKVVLCLGVFVFVAFPACLLDGLNPLQHWQYTQYPSVGKKWSSRSQQVKQMRNRTNQARSQPRQPRDIDSQGPNSFPLNHRCW